MPSPPGKIETPHKKMKYSQQSLVYQNPRCTAFVRNRTVEMDERGVQSHNSVWDVYSTRLAEVSSCTRVHTSTHVPVFMYGCCSWTIYVRRLYNIQLGIFLRRRVRKSLLEKIRKSSKRSKMKGTAFTFNGKFLSFIFLFLASPH